MIRSHPFGRPGVPEAEADGHGAGKEQNNIPGNFFQVVDIKDDGIKKGVLAFFPLLLGRGQEREEVFLGARRAPGGGSRNTPSRSMSLVFSV